MNWGTGATPLRARRWTLSSYDQQALEKLSRSRHEKDSYIASVRSEIELQEKLLSQDQLFSDNRSDSAWNGERRKEE
jgi:monovalent cation:H+ antiporter-2, CPA2 family